MIKRFLSFSFLIGSALLFTGCLAMDSSFTTIEYNNAIVEVLNTASSSIEETTTTYDTSIPNIVTEDSEIDTSAMQTIYNEALTHIEDAETILTLTSRNADQQAAISEGFATYLDLGQKYLTTYSEMIEYYNSNAFKDDLDQVATFDEDLHVQYNDFIESNNALVDVLATFIE